MAKSPLQAALALVAAEQERIRTELLPKYEANALVIVQDAIAALEANAAAARTAVEEAGLAEHAPALPETLINGHNPLFLGPLGHIVNNNKRMAEVYQAGTAVNGVVIPPGAYATSGYAQVDGSA